MDGKKDEQLSAKFKVIDGRRFQLLDDSNYFLPNDSGEEERLDLQHAILKHAFNGNFSAPVDQLLRSGARVLDVGLVGKDKVFNATTYQLSTSNQSNFLHSCGSGIWTLDLAKEYPNSYFIGIDIVPTVLTGEKPSNVEFIEYNVLDGLPFNNNSFDYVFARALISVYSRAQWTELAIPEYSRVTKPGGWVELMEFDGIVKGECENVQRMNSAGKLEFEG